MINCEHGQGRGRRHASPPCDATAIMVPLDDSILLYKDPLLERTLSPEDTCVQVNMKAVSVYVRKLGTESVAVPLKNRNIHEDGKGCISFLESRLLNFPVFFECCHNFIEEDFCPEVKTLGCFGGVSCCAGEAEGLSKEPLPHCRTGTTEGEHWSTTAGTDAEDNIKHSATVKCIEGGTVISF